MKMGKNRQSKASLVLENINVKLNLIRTVEVKSENICRDSCMPSA